MAMQNKNKNKRIRKGTMDGTRHREKEEDRTSESGDKRLHIHASISNICNKLIVIL
jgi:hypothetical protein